jgi:hypothetical protein
VARRAQALPDPVPTPVQQRAVEELRRDGVALVAFDDLFEGRTLWERLDADMSHFVSETEALLPSTTREDRDAMFGKSFLVRRFRARKGEARPLLSLANPWVALGASPEFLDIVNAFRGRPMRLHDFDNWYTVPDPEIDRRGSQRWHRDGWEDHLVKVFTYFNDVSAEAGPFEYILGSAAGGKYGELWPWADKEVYPPPEELAAAVDPDDVVTLTGGPGTIVFCDTSGFHRGGFARTRPRILSYHTYLSDEVQRRRGRKFEVEWSLEETPEQTRFALG